MRTAKIGVALYGLTVVFLSSIPAGAVDIPDDVKARISRAKSEQSALASERARRKLDDGGEVGRSGITPLGNDGCTIAVGTVVEDDKRIRTSARQETTVIVTGDIIQVGNDCR